MTARYKLTILFDNYPGPPGFKMRWGFAALIQTPDRTLLFDTDGIQQTIRTPQALGVPTHCTGDEAIAAFGRAYGADCIAGGVGNQSLIRDR